MKRVLAVLLEIVAGAVVALVGAILFLTICGYVGHWWDHRNDDRWPWDNLETFVATEGPEASRVEYVRLTCDEIPVYCNFDEVWALERLVKSLESPFVRVTIHVRGGVWSPYFDPGPAVCWSDEGESWSDDLQFWPL